VDRTHECTGDPEGADEEFEDQLMELLEALLPVGGSVSATTTCDQYGATFSIYTESESVTEVVDLAIAIFLAAVNKADLPPWPIVRCEVLTFAAHDAELRAPNPN
jgi:hypothetical protein